MGVSTEVPALIDYGFETWQDLVRSAARPKQPKLAVRGEKLFDDALILLGLARACGVDQSAARAHPTGGPIEHRELDPRQPVEIGLGAAPADLGVSPDRAETGAWDIDEDAVETLAEGKGLAEIHLHEANRGRRAAGHGLSKQVESLISKVGRDQQTSILHHGRQRQRLAAWRRAGVEDTVARLHAGECGDQLGRFVLHDEPATIGEGGCERVAPRHDEAVWRVARGPNDDRVGRERVDEITGPNFQAVYPQGEGRGRVVEASPGGRDGEPMAIQPALDEPARVREGDAEIIQRRGSSTPEPTVGVGRQRVGGGHEFWRFWKRQLLALARDGAEDRVHEAGGAAFARASSQLDGIVHRRRGRHPIQVQQLVDAEAKDVQDFRVEPSGRAPCEVRDQVVEGALPSQGAGGDLAGERTVTRVAEGRAGVCERLRQVRASLVHGPQNVVRRPASWSDHYPGEERKVDAGTIR